MRSSWISIEHSTAGALCRCGGVSGVLLVGADRPCAAAQDAAPPTAAPRPPPKPGVFESIGRWFDQGTSDFRDHLRGAKQRMDDLGDEAAANTKGLSDQAAKVGQGAAEVGKSAADATANAVDAVAKLPAARHDERPRALRGGAERRARLHHRGRSALPQAWLRSGKSMDFTSAEECPARTLLGQTSRDECTP